MKKKVLVGMSGGIDSSVTAALLIEQGYQVQGATMKIWAGKGCSSGKKHACYGPEEQEDIEDASRVARQLSIPFTVIGLEQEYQDMVLDYFTAEYMRGRTPNPCVRCNQKVKFGFLIEKALAMGLDFDYFATGHYARVSHNQQSGRYELKKAFDRTKDQVYFLTFLQQEQLARTLFPLGEIKKKEVKRLAGQFHLPVLSKPESQDFVDSSDYSLIFREPVPEGPVIDCSGQILGRHKGIIYYTTGQRRGLGIAAKEPLYVLRIDREKNALIVGPEELLYSRRLTASCLNWIACETLDRPMEVMAKIRLAHREAAARIEPLEGGMVAVCFEDPQRGVTPGQTIAFYHDDLLLGGGIIETVEDCIK